VDGRGVCTEMEQRVGDGRGGEFRRVLQERDATSQIVLLKQIRRGLDGTTIASPNVPECLPV
jgi:hypothetical protein